MSSGLRMCPWTTLRTFPVDKNEHKMRLNCRHRGGRAARQERGNTSIFSSHIVTHIFDTSTNRRVRPQHRQGFGEFAENKSACSVPTASSVLSPFSDDSLSLRVTQPTGAWVSFAHSCCTCLRWVGTICCLWKHNCFLLLLFLRGFFCLLFWTNSQCWFGWVFFFFLEIALLCCYLILLFQVRSLFGKGYFLHLITACVWPLSQRVRHLNILCNSC